MFKNTDTNTLSYNLKETESYSHKTKNSEQNLVFSLHFKETNGKSLDNFEANLFLLKSLIFK